MRLLHAGHDHDGQTDPGTQPASDRRRNSRWTRWQFVPLHGLSAHRQRGEICRGKGRCINMATTTITKTPVIEKEKLVGKGIRRREDPRLITGTAIYVEDIQMPGMHHACIVRSPHGAAKIKSIDTKAASEHAGVVAVFTGKDTEGLGP